MCTCLTYILSSVDKCYKGLKLSQRNDIQKNFHSIIFQLEAFECRFKAKGEEKVIMLNRSVYDLHQRRHLYGPINVGSVKFP